MSHKSIEEIWQQIESERQQRLSNEKIAYEQQIVESEKQRQAYLSDVSMNESIFSVGAASAAAGAGGGGHKRSIASSGQATLFKFEEDELNKYLIYNFDTKESTGVLSFGLTTDYYNQFSLSVTDNGFVEVFSNNSVYVIIAFDLSGNIKSQKTISGYTEYYGIDTKAIILYNENDLYYAFEFDGTNVRIHQFTESISLDDNYDPYFNGGYILRSEANHYLVPNTGNPILIHTIEENTTVSTHLYAYSTTFSMIIYDSNNFLSEMKIYNSSGSVLLTFNFKDLSNTLNGIYTFNFMNESDGITLSSYDNDSLFYIFYYSPESNTITYQITDLPNRETFLGLDREYDDNNNQICSAGFYLLYSGSYTQSNGLLYYDSNVFILPIFKGDTEIREFIEITNDSKSLSFTYLKIFEDRISMLVDNGNATYDLMNININGTVTYTSTDIDYAEPIAYYLLSERVIFYLNNSIYVLSNTGITQSLTGITVSGYTISRNTLVINSNSNTYYTNSAVGNTFILLDNYYENSDTSNDQVTNDDGYKDGNILIYNYETQLAQIISDEFESSVINMQLIDASINKQSFFLGKNYLGILQDTSQDSIPYTHTKLSVDGPVDPNNFITDGIILSGSGYFSPIASSPSSAYFTNLYPGLFVMVADQCSVDSFGTTGNLGADGSGTVDSYDFVIADTFSIDYAVFTKRIYDSGDPSVNHMIIVENKPGIEHIYSKNTDNDIDTISGISECYRIHYLVFSKSSGGFVTDQEMDQIANAYLSIVDNKSLANILTQLNTDYSNVTNPIINEIYYFSDTGGDGGSIGDGGNDMYDTGNKMVSSVGEFLSVVLAYYSLEGEEVNRLESIISQSIDVDDVFGDRYYGLYIDQPFVFTGEDIIVYTFPTNSLNTELNDYYWWND